MKLIKLNDKIINMDQIAFIERREGRHVWIYFDASRKGSPDIPLDETESVKLWDYLRSVATDVIALDIDRGVLPQSE